MRRTQPRTLAERTLAGVLASSLAVPQIAVPMWLVPSLVLPAGAAMASTPRPALTAIEAIDVVEAGDTTVISVRGQNAPTFTTFRLESPPRLFVDIAGADPRLIARPVQVQNGVIRSVEAVPFRQRDVDVARVIVTFDVDALFHVRADGNAVVIVVDGSDRKLSAEQTRTIAVNNAEARSAASRER